MALGPGGGVLTVRARVEDAASCQLRLLSTTLAVVFASNVRPCTSTFSAHVTVGANTKAEGQVITFELLVRKGPEASSGRFYIAIAGLPRATVVAVTTTPAVLGPGGGTVVVAGTVENAASCRLELLSSPSLVVVYPRTPSAACRGGNYLGKVVIRSNAKASQQVIAFALVARNSVSEATW